MSEISDTIKGSYTAFFGTVRQNVFGRRFWYSPPSFSSTNLFATGNFPKRSSEGFPCNVFWHCETKKSTKNRDIFLLSIKFFDTRNQWQPRRFPYEFFRHCETKRFRQKFLILPTPSFSSTNFVATGNFPKHITERFPFKVFGSARQKIRRKIVTYSF